MSLALAHKRRTLGQGSAAAVASATPTAYSPAAAMASPANAQKHYKLIEDALLVDLERLSGINSLEQRQVIKRDELLPKYLEYVGRYRESGLNFPNQVLMYTMVWLFDTAQFEQGLELAGFAMSQDQKLPFDRDVPTFIADEVIAWAEAEHKAGRSPEPYVSDMLPWVDGQWKLYERIPARYHRLLGIMAIDRRDWAVAIGHFERAEALYQEIRVTTRLEGARKALAKAIAKGEQPTAQLATRLDEVLLAAAEKNPVGDGTDAE